MGGNSSSSEQQQRPHSAGTMESDKKKSRRAVSAPRVCVIRRAERRERLLMQMIAEEMAPLRMEIKSVKGLQVSSSSDVPTRRHSFNRLMDFDSDVSAVKDLNKSLDDPEEMNQELSSEVGWKHG